MSETNSNENDKLIEEASADGFGPSDLKVITKIIMEYNLTEIINLDYFVR